MRAPGHPAKLTSMRRFLAAFLALCVARVSSPAAAFAADIVEAPAARVAPASMAPTPVGFGLPAFGQAPLSGVELNSAGLALQAPTPARAASADAAALETRAAASSAAVMPQTAASAAGVLAVSDLAAASAVAAAPPATSHATGVRSLAGREFHRSFEPDGRYARVAKAWSRLEETAPAAPAASAKSPPRLLRFAARAAPVALALAFPVLAHAAPAVQPAAQAVPGFASALALGFWLGVKHAADADHVAAV